MLNRRYKNDGKPNIYLNQVQGKHKLVVTKRIKDQNYKFEKTSCLACGNENYEQLSEKDRYGLYHSVVICRDCGLIQNSPRMTQESYNFFYNDSHRRLYIGSLKPTEAYFKERYDAGRMTADYLRSIINICGSQILEVGCGSGAILKYLQDAGAVVTGLDLSHEYLEYGIKNYQLNLHSVDLMVFTADTKYDLVIYSDVLEHVLNIDEHLTKIKSLLSENGLLYIKVPGVKNTHVDYRNDLLNSFQNAHVYYFSLTTLSNILHKHGFEMVCGDEKIQSLWKPSLTTKSILISDYAESIKYLKKLEKKVLSRMLRKLETKIVRLISQFKFLFYYFYKKQ